ncbi:MAG: hypothetical protein JHD15_07165 [Phenylobacterium sp.]|uniref:hypothetical protein n=1 Tax=Phenylobacterium sp. TaxID=1871053 RepID=UPI001A256518|nr:hypothetical protein [Phenylobacterium sp.]MBJ7410133.1 hypothetical protein [Phenylobacterium sp.]
MARGGKRPGAGRPAGAPNKATKDIRDAAQEYSELALQVLVDVATNGDSAAAKVAAANAILDRAHGKPKQSVEATGADGAPLLPALKVTFA